MFFVRQVADLAGGWQWALRVTPFLGLVLLVVTAIFAIEPVRGAVERDAAARDAAAGNTSAPNALNTTAASVSPGDTTERAPLVERPAPVGGATSSAEPGPPAQSKLDMWLADLRMLAQTCVVLPVSVADKISLRLW